MKHSMKAKLKAKGKQKSQSIISLIKEDHKPLKVLIKILTSTKSSESERKKALKNFLFDLKLHARAEEMSLYENIMNEDKARSTALEGLEEHNLANLLSEQLENSGYQVTWSEAISAKAKVLAELVQHHLQEEESELFPSLKNSIESQELLHFGELYLENYKQLKKELLANKKLKSPLPRDRKNSREIDIAITDELLGPASH